MSADTNIFQGEFVLDEQNISMIQNITELMPTGFFMIGKGDTHFSYANTEMLNMLGFNDIAEFDEIVDGSLKGIILPEDYGNVTGMTNRFIEQKKWDFDPLAFRVRRKDGEIRWLIAYAHYRPASNYGSMIFAYVHDYTEKNMHAQEDRRKTEVIKGLSSGYNAIYLVDFELNKMYPYSTNNAVSKSMKYSFVKDLDYTTTIQEFCDSFVYPEDADLYLYEASAERIKERIVSEPFYSVIFRRYNERHNLEYVQMSISRSDDKNRFSRVVQTYKTVTGHVLDEQEEAFLAKTASIMKILEKDYIGMIDVNLDTGKEVQYPLADSKYDIPVLARSGMYRESYTSFVNTYMVPEYRKDFLEKADISYLRSIHGVIESFDQEYEIETRGVRKTLVTHYVLKNDASGVPHVFIGTKAKK